MINAEDKQKIKDDVRNCFIERNENTIYEKISDLISAGFTEGEAHDAVIQVVKNLSSFLLPLKIVVAKKDVYSDELTLDEKMVQQRRMFIVMHGH